MARILITSGPTRQYLDPVRYLTNASSGRMGRALAAAALELGHEAVVISGPVAVEYPSEAERIDVVSTREMLEACQRVFPRCDGLIAAAAPADYEPVKVASHKIAKKGQPLLLRLLETPDVVAALGARKRPDQWMIGFALETEDQRLRALAKLEKKSCDLMVVNGPEAISSEENRVEVMDRDGRVIASFQGAKEAVARGILRVADERLIGSREGQSAGGRR